MTRDLRRTDPQAWRAYVTTPEAREARAQKHAERRERMRHNQEELKRLKDRVDELEKDMSEHPIDLSRLKPDTTGIEAEVKALKDSNTALSSAVASLQADVSTSLVTMRGILNLFSTMQTQLAKAGIPEILLENSTTLEERKAIVDAVQEKPSPKSEFDVG